LQLINDLQDVRDDIGREQQTLAGTMARSGSLHEFTNGLLSFIPRVIDLEGEECAKLRQLIERSCRLLILEAVACNSDYYHPSYLMAMEEHSPVRFDYLRAMKSRLQKKYDRRWVERYRKRAPQGSFGKKRILKFAS